MSNPPSSQSHSAWVQNALSELLVAPHISFRGPPWIRMGPGPIDVFSTKFNNIFVPEAKGTVAGEQLDREGIKEKLLALQHHYSPDSVKFQTQEPDSNAPSDQHDPDEVRFSFAWTSKDAQEHEVSTAAVVTTQGGVTKITFLTLDGEPQLFATSAA